MADKFSLLEDCDDSLPSADVIDRISFYRFLPIEVTDGAGNPHNAVFPIDHAVPEMVREQALHGWPPDNIALARGGLSLLPEWEDPTVASEVKPLVEFALADLNEFLTDPRAEIEGRRVRLDLTTDHVAALLTIGRTIVRRRVGPPIRLKSPVNLPERDEIIVPSLPALLAAQASRNPPLAFDLSPQNVAELRERGNTWIPLDRRQGSVHLVAESHAVTVRSESPQTFDLPPDLFMNLELPEAELAVSLPDLPFVVYLAYEQQWTLDGYARGELIDTIELSANGEATIEVFSWDRFKESDETTVEAAWETTLEANTTARAARDIASQVTENEVWKLTQAGVQVGVPEKFEVGANLAGNFGNELTEVNSDTTKLLGEVTTKAANKARGLRQTKVSKAREFGFEERFTHKLKNPNLCHTLSYDVFEILASYTVKTRPLPEKTRLGVLVPSPLSFKFDRTFLLTNEGVLRRALLDARQAIGFDAARWLAARDEYCVLRCEPPCCPEKTKTDGSSTSTTLPVDPSNEEVAKLRVQHVGLALADAIRKIDEAKHGVAAAYDAGLRGAALEDKILEYRQWLFRVFGLEKFQPGFWGACRRFRTAWIGGDVSPECVERFLTEASGAWAEAVARVALGALLFGIWSIVDLAFGLIAHLGWKVGWYMEYTARGFDDAGLGALLNQARADVDLWRQSLQSTSTTQPQIPPLPQVPGEEQAKPPEPFPNEEAASHKVAERSLLAHIEQYRDHYVEAMWRSFNPTSLAGLLSNTCGNLASEVDLEVLGFVGDQIVLPFRASKYAGLAKILKDAIEGLDVAALSTEVEVVVPTRAIHLQTRLGECEGCEPFILRQRQLDIKDKRVKIRAAKAAARRSELEGRRLKARLDATEPLLEDPTSNEAVLAVRILSATAPDGTPGNPQ